MFFNFIEIGANCRFLSNIPTFFSFLLCIKQQFFSDDRFCCCVR
ncbi:hypothetical protein l11_09470 [Neisseria weaveri LMG 5135]|nr:hypothetical protein l11_09470 [Neisseria weaveri LMG 5135]